MAFIFLHSRSLLCRRRRFVRRIRRASAMLMLHFMKQQRLEFVPVNWAEAKIVDLIQSFSDFMLTVYPKNKLRL